MDYVTLICACINCGQPLTCNPARAPSIRVNDVKEPLCLACAREWNRIHRTSKGLPPIPIDADAYSACPEQECP
jgi:hypothetical protein